MIDFKYGSNEYTLHIPPHQKTEASNLLGIERGRIRLGLPSEAGFEGRPGYR